MEIPVVNTNFSGESFHIPARTRTPSGSVVLGDVHFHSRGGAAALLRPQVLRVQLRALKVPGMILPFPDFR